jgi:hypothetical protein
MRRTQTIPRDTQYVVTLHIDSTPSKMLHWEEGGGNMENHSP